MFQIGCSALFTKIKACVRYFLSTFFPQMIALQKLLKNVFHFILKLFLFLRYSIFGNFLSPFLHFPDSKEEMEVGYLLML